jgi:hypothetical protein
MFVFFINCILITSIIYYIHNIYNKKEIDFNDIWLFVLVSLFICNNFPCIYVAIVTKRRFDF